MLLVVRRGKYDIEYMKAIVGDEYAITVIFDNKTIMVRTMKLSLGEYKLEIKNATAYDDYLDVKIRQLYGKKFRKNFETMKKLIDPLFKKQGIYIGGKYV